MSRRRFMESHECKLGSRGTTPPRSFHSLGSPPNLGGEFSGPQLLRGEGGAFTQSLEFRPDHGWVNLGAVGCLRGETAIRACDDILAADQPRKANQAFGNQFGVFHDVAGVCDHAGDKDFAVRQLRTFPNVIFVLMPWIRCFEAVGAGIYFQNGGSNPSNRSRM